MSTSRRIYSSLAAGCWLFAAVSPALCQTASANINGYVRDSSGAAIPNATVTARMSEQQLVRTAPANSEGFYQLLALPSGTYDVTVEAPGFQRQTQTGLALTVNQNLRVDSTLQVGTVESQVTVDAIAPLVDTTSATMSGLIDDRRVVDLPLNGRNVIGLARILPGVLNVSAPQQMNDARGGPGLNVNGGRSNMNLFTLNGGFFNNPSRNTGMNYPPPDAVQEVRILTHNFAAEYGRNPGSQVNVVSRSGSNEFHGSAWEFLRNDALNARNFFSSRVPALKQNQFGAAAGAPDHQGSGIHIRHLSGTAGSSRSAIRTGICAFRCTTCGRFHVFGGNSDEPCGYAHQSSIHRRGGKSLCGRESSRHRLHQPRGTESARVRADIAHRGGKLSGRQSPRRRLCTCFAGTGTRARSTESMPAGSRIVTTGPRHFAGGNIPGYIGEMFDQKTQQLAINDTITFSPTLINQFTFGFLNTPSNQLQSETIDPQDARDQHAAICAHGRGNCRCRRQLHTWIRIHDKIQEP